MTYHWVPAMLLFAMVLVVRPAEAQTPARFVIAQVSDQADQPGRVLSSQIEVARDRATLHLELAGGERLDFGIYDGQAWVRDNAVGPAPRGATLDLAWRELLETAMETPPDELPALLAGWEPPISASGTRTTFYSEIMKELAGSRSVGAVEGRRGDEQAEEGDGTSIDTIAKLEQKIAELEQRVEGERARATGRRGSRPEISTSREIDRRSTLTWYSPLRHIGRGLAALLGDLVLLTVLVGIGFAVVYFARKPLETIADTARNEPLRSGIVGLAGTFLVLPGFVLGTLALVISIVGIPLLLLWAPLFWLAIGVAALLGYLAISHGVGEGIAERRFYGSEWARRANSYYYVLTGLIVLFVPFLAGHIVEMAGPWLGFVRGLLIFLGSVLTWAVFTIGFGAVLLTRAGTRPRSGPDPSSAELEMEDLFEGSSHV